MLVLPARAVSEASWGRRFKHFLNAVALGVVSPAALTCWLERRGRPRAQGFFSLWAHIFAVLPGTPGMFLRRAFYRWTLEGCAEEVTIEFGALFSRRTAVLETGVYVGAYALIGSAWIRAHSLIGSRASLLSGGQHHELLPSGRWSATDDGKLHRIVIGANTWVGEGAILMAGTGDGCMVAAGSVVSSTVPPGVMVAGNPARFVRSLAVRPPVEADDDPSISSIR